MWPILLSFAIILAPFVSSNDSRKCCRYNSIKDNSDLCSSKNSCVLYNQSMTTSAPDDQCMVTYDTKAGEESLDIKKDCLGRSFKSKRRYFHEMDPLPFYVHSYPFTQLDPDVPHFTGMDFRYQYNLFDKLKFRIKNTNPKICPSQVNETSVCNPRCVEINKSNSKPSSDSTQNMAYLSYDCEVGFYISKKGKLSVETTGDTYELSVCSWEDAEKDEDMVCGEYMFQLPSPTEVDTSVQDHQVLLLIDKQEMDYNDKIVLYIPTSHNADMYLVEILFTEDLVNKIIKGSQSVDVPEDVGSTLRVVMEYPYPSGGYQVSVTPFQGNQSISSPSLSSMLIRPKKGQHALGIITAVLVVIIIVGCFLFIYRRWQQVAGESAVEPGKLVEAGRIDPKSVLVVTPLDNPDHVEVVKDMCRYLRDWCGVGTTYFALDEVTGIQSGAGQRDPWKWCQETGDEVREEGVVVFIAGPNPALAGRSSIHPNLDKNQAFLTTSHLRIMADQGRAIVVKFSYSDMDTIPSDVPEHLKNSAYHLPKYMNNFLCHLLQVKKRDLCSMLPLRLVTPEIYPANLTRSGGPELQEKIRELSLKDHKYRLDHADNRYSTAWNDRLVWSRDRPLSAGNEGATSDSEDRPLYPANSVSPVSRPNGTTKIDKEKLQPTLRVELEGGMPSVKHMQNRDKALSDEV